MNSIEFEDYMTLDVESKFWVDSGCVMSSNKVNSLARDDLEK
jgi:hypothetical protein